MSEAVLAAAGGSIVADEGRGDYRRVLHLGTQAGRAARSADARSPERTDALLASGVAALLLGSPRLAERRLRLAGAEGNPVDLAVPARTLAHLAFLSSWYLLPGGGSNILLTDCRWRADVPAEVAGAQRQREADWQLLPAPATACLQALVYDLLFAAGSVLGSDFATGRLVAPESAARLASGLAGRLDRLLQQAAQVGDAALVAFTLRLAAQVAHRLGEPAEAGLLLDQAQTVYADAGDLAGGARCRLVRADWRAAPLSGAVLLDLAVQESGTSGSDLSPLHDSLEVTAQPADVQAAAELLDEAEDLASRGRAGRLLGMIRLHRAAHAFLLDDHRAQAEHADAALDEFRACGDTLHGTLAAAHVMAAEVAVRGAHAAGRPLRAIAEHVRAGGSLSHGLGLCFLLARTGRHWLLRRGDRERALAAYELAGRLAELIGAGTTAAQAVADRAAAWGSIGLRHQRQALLEAAADRYLAEMAAHPKIRSDCARRARDAALTVLNAALQGTDVDDVDRAIGVANRVLDRTGARSTALPTDRDSLLSLARADPDRFQDALFIQALDVALPQARMIRTLLASRDLRWSDGQAAVAAYEEALAQAAEMPGSAAFFWAAVVHRLWRRDDAAVQAYQDYLARGGHSAAEIGELSSPLQAFGAAGEQTLAEYRHTSDRDAALFFSSAGRFDLARRHLEVVAATAGPDWWRKEPEPWAPRALLAEVAEGDEDLDDALAGYTEAIELTEQQWNDLTTDENRTAWGDNRSVRSIYLCAARATLAARSAADALTLIERSRSRALLELAAATRAAAGLPPELAGQLRMWRRAAARAAALRRAYAKDPVPPLAAELHRADRDARSLAAPAFGHVRGGVLDPSAIGRRLPPRAVLLTWAAAGRSLLTFTVTPDGAVEGDHRRTDVDRLEADLRNFTAACRTGSTDGEAGRRAAELLLEPVADRLAAAAEVVLVPWGAAHAAPLHALPLDGIPLIGRVPVSYLPSASLLPEPGRRRPDGTLALGDPEAMRWRSPGAEEDRPFPPLPNARLEAAAVAALHQPATPLLGPDASLRRVLPDLSRKRTVHLATHGIVLPNAPELSAVLLAEGDVLTVADLLGVELDLDLVVLSACDTGAGRITDGGEVLGLSRALLASGVRHAVVSLWPAADLPACLLMVAMHARIRAGERTAAALAHAQRTVAALTLAEQLDLALDLQDWLAAGGHPKELPIPTGPPPQLTWTPGGGQPAYWAPFLHIGTADER